MPRRKKDEALDVKFDTRAIRNKARSDGERVIDNENKVVHEIKAEGRDVFDNTAYVHIEIPGDKTCQVDRPATFCGGAPVVFPLEGKPNPDFAKGHCRAPHDERGNPRLEECDVHRFPDEWLAYCGGVEQMSGTPLANWGQIDPASLRELAYFNVYTVEQLSQLNDSNASRFFHLRQKARDFLTQENSKDKQIAAMAERLAALEAKAAVGKAAAK